MFDLYAVISSSLGINGVPRYDVKEEAMGEMSGQRCGGKRRERNQTGRAAKSFQTPPARQAAHLSQKTYALCGMGVGRLGGGYSGESERQIG